MIQVVLIAHVVLSFPLSDPASDHQFSVEENEISYSGKIHHHHRRHTHSQDTLCHTHTKNSEYSPPEGELSNLWYVYTLMLFSCSSLYVGQHPVLAHLNHTQTTISHYEDRFSTEKAVTLEDTRSMKPPVSFR